MEQAELFQSSLAAATYARSEMNRLIGISLTQALSQRCRTNLLLGRITTPVLAMVLRREREIETFSPSLHHEVVAHFITSNTIFSGLCTAGEEGTKFKNRAFAENVLRDCVDSVAWLTSCSEETIRPSPPQLYNLTDLQQQANIRHNLPTEKTREICQLLYDKGIITTPLTTSRLVCFNYFNKLDKILLALHSSMPGLVNRVFNSDYKTRIDKRVVSAPPGDAHGILPTTTSIDLRSLAEEERMIYDLIGRRLVAALLPPPKIRKVSIMLKTSGVPFKAECQIVENEGWLEAQPWDRPSETPPPSDLSVAAVKILSFSIRDCWGCAPMPYSDASLLLAMEDAEKKYLTEPGRGPAVARGDIIERLVRGERGIAYLKRDREILRSTPHGQRLFDLLLELEPQVPGLSMLTDLKTAMKWENKLVELAKDKGNFQNRFREFQTQAVIEVEKMITGIKKAVYHWRPEEDSLGRCPKCKKGKILVRSKSYGCSEWRRDGSGCDFVIFKKMHGIIINPTNAIELLADGKIPVTCTSKEGKKYQAELKINPETFVVERVLPWLENSTPLGPCPACGAGEIQELKWGFACSRRRHGCGFMIGKFIGESEEKRGMNREAVQELLEKGSTQNFYWFSSKKGAFFQAQLVLEEGLPVMLFKKKKWRR